MRFDLKLAVAAIFLCSNGSALAANSEGEPEDWAIHAQSTAVLQYHPGFRSPYRGRNSLDPASRGNETFDATLFAGARLFDGLELWINPEIDQGFGLSGTFGAAGFPSGEAYKVGKAEPYFRLQRLFFRETFNLGGEVQPVEADANQLRGTRTADNLIVTFGKLSVTDMFDTNAYAHDPRSDFFNWSVIDAGAYDYAADAWAYSYGVAAEWTQDFWTLRFGLFDLSKVPNTTHLETDFSQFQLVAEGEARVSLFGRPGRVKLLGFVNRGRMADYSDAVRLAVAAGVTPDVALVRDYRSRPGVTANLEQEVAQDLGAFLRLSWNDGSKEAYEFTEINRSVSGGLSLKGASWGRAKDTVGLAGVVNGLSSPAKAYFGAGGLGILIGDGRLPHYGTENILETYYSAAITDWFSLSGDYQLLVHPAYNRDRGPVSVFALRAHAGW
jgi:high affinity Mn2+ porin